MPSRIWKSIGSNMHVMQDINVVVLANLKPRNMRGIKSNGMLMAASDASHETVELLKPLDGSIPGERIWFGSEEEKDQQADAATPNQVSALLFLLILLCIFLIVFDICSAFLIINVVCLFLFKYFLKLLIFVVHF